MKFSSLVAVALVIFSTQQVLATPTPCAELTQKGEAQEDQGDKAAAEKSFEGAVKACRAANEGSARPFIALGSIYVHSNRSEKAIPLFKEALTQEPNLPLAYMDLSAAYLETKQYDQSVDAGKKAVEAAKKMNDKNIEAEANYNIGFTLFRKAAFQGPQNDLSSEAYFKESMKIDPAIGANYFYLGVLAEVIKNNPADAKKFYTQGCDRKYTEACNYLTKLNAKVAAGTAGAPVASGASAPAKVNVSLSPKEKELYQKIRAKYLEKGVPPANVDTMISTMQTNYAQIPEENRLKALEAMAKP